MDPIFPGSDEEMETTALPTASTNEPQQVRTTRRKLHRMKLMPGAQSPGRESVLSQDSQEPIEESGDGATAAGSLEEDETTQLALSQLADLPGENGSAEGGLGFGGLEQEQGLPSSNDALLDGGGDEGDGAAGLVMNEEDADRLLDENIDSGIQQAIFSGQEGRQGEEIAESPLDTRTFAADDEIQFLSSNTIVRPSTPPYVKEEAENSPGGGADEETEDDECMIIGQVGPANKPALLVKHESPLPQAVYQPPQVITLADDGEDEGGEALGTVGSNENEAAQNRHSSTDDLSSDEDGAPLSVRSETGEDEGVNAAMEKEREEDLQLLVAEEAPSQRIDPWVATGQLQQHEPLSITNPEAERMNRIMTEALLESQVGREAESGASASSSQPAEGLVQESSESQQGKVVVGRKKVSQPTAVTQPLRARPRHRQLLKKVPLAIVDVDDTAEMDSTCHQDSSNVEIKSEPGDPLHDNAAVDYSDANRMEEPLDPANMDLIDSVGSVDMEICDTPTRAKGSEQQPSEQPAPPNRSDVEMEVEDAAPPIQSIQPDQLPRRPSGFGGGIESATIQQLRANHCPPSFPERTGLDIPLLPHHQSLSSPPRLENMMPAGASGSEEVSPGEPIPTINRRRSRLGQRTPPFGRAQATQMQPFFEPAANASFQQRVNNLQQIWTGQPLRMPMGHRPPSPADFSQPLPMGFDVTRPPPPPPPGIVAEPTGRSATAGKGAYHVNTHAARNLLEQRGVQVGPDGAIGDGVGQPVDVHPLQRSRCINRSIVRFQDERHEFQYAIAQEEFDKMPYMTAGYQSDAGHRSNLHRTPSRGRRSATPFRFPVSPREIAERHSGDDEINRARSRSRPRVRASGARSQSRPRVPSGTGAPLTGANTEEIYFDPAQGTVRGDYDPVTIRNLNRMCGDRFQAARAPAIGQIPIGISTRPQYERRTPRRPQRAGAGAGAESESSSGGGFSPRRQRRSPSPCRVMHRPRGRSETRRWRRMSPSPVRRHRPDIMRSRSRHRRSPAGARTSRERIPHGPRQAGHHSRPRRSDPTDHRRKRHLSGLSDDGSVSSSDTDSVSSAELRRRMDATEVDIKLYKAMKVKEALARKLAKREKRAERDNRTQDNGGGHGGVAGGSTDRDGAQRPGPSRRMNGGRPPSPKRRSTRDGSVEAAQPPLVHEMRVEEVQDGDDDCVIIPPRPVLIKREIPDEYFRRRGRVVKPLTAAELDQCLDEYRARSSQAATERVATELAGGLEQQTL